MHPTQHSTIARRAARAAVQTHTGTIACTADDVLEAIARTAARQSTGYVMIAHLRDDLGLTTADLPWLRRTLQALDLSGQICLSLLEMPQALPAHVAEWYAENASHLRCHEVCLNQPAESTTRIAPLLRKHEQTTLFPSATDKSTHNPVLCAARQTQLVQGIANTLQTLGRAHARPPLNQRLARLFTMNTETGRAA